MRLSLSPALRAQIRELDLAACTYCHSPEQLSVSSFEVDHIVPISAGGLGNLDNLCLACSSCNRLKGSRQEYIDPATGSTVPLFHPRRQLWSDHFGWSQDRTQVIGLTATGRATAELLQMNRPQLVRLRRLWHRLGFRADSSSLSHHQSPTG